MPSAAALRIEIKYVLERRFPATLTPVPRSICETAPTGITEVDDAPGEAVEVPAKQAPRYRRRQSAELER